MGCLTCYNKVEEFIGTKFESYAGFVCKHPWKFIFVPLIINGLLGIGLVNLKSDNDVERIYTPMNSQASKDRSTLRKIFGDFSAKNFYTQSQIESGIYGDIIFEAKQGKNILGNLYLSEMKEVYGKISSLQFTDSVGSLSNLSKVCARRDNACVVDGHVIFNPWFQSNLNANTIPYPGSGATSLQGIFGDVVVSNGILTNASFVKLRYHLKHETQTNKDDNILWMASYIKKIEKITTNHTNIYYAHSESLDEELNANIGGDIVFFSLTFTLMIVYATTATSNYKCVSDRQNLGRAGVLAAAFAILGSFGLIAACGLEFVSIVGTMPFLIIGIGVDDMFLLLSGLAETYDCKNALEPEDRIKKTLRSSGVGITITSLTDLIAFLVGASSSFISVRNFCVYTGIAVLFCYLNYVTFFVGCMVIHERRVSGSRHACTCQVISHSKKEGRSNCLQGQPHSCMCTGSIPTKRSEVEGPFEKYPPKIISRLVLQKPIKVIILVGFAVYLGISIWGATKFEQGLTLNDLVTEDSYYYSYSQLNEKYFSSSFAISVNIPNTLKYSDVQTWNKILALQTLLQQDERVENNLRLNWLEEFRNSTVYDGSSEINFISALRSNFLPVNPHFKNDIKFDTSNVTIVASRFYVFSFNVEDSADQGELMKRVRKTASSSVIPEAIVYSPAFIFFEQYVAILPNTLQTLGIATVVIFIVTAIFLPHPVLVLFVTLTLAMILVGLIGFMHFWGLTLSSITMIHIIMSVGFSVDFSAHVCHGFMESAKSNRDDGAKGAIVRAGGPIFNGAVSSILGIIMLSFSKSFIFRSFFKVMLLIVLFGASHSLLFLPVILSLCGPKFKNNGNDEKISSQAEKRDKNQPRSNMKTSHKNEAFGSELSMTNTNSENGVELTKIQPRKLPILPSISNKH
ncbi:patched domain-containing protein 3-like [Mytilus trossulus]|uniref:patched domain-containing protein 3-like n=1 Tax=Mytilus trossulus TaxID=6551 RepID=UPI00300416A0